MAKAKKAAMPKSISDDLRDAIFSAYDELIVATVECEAAKQAHKDARDKLDVATSRLVELVREARMPGEKLPFGQPAVGGAPDKDDSEE